MNFVLVFGIETIDVYGIAYQRNLIEMLKKIEKYVKDKEKREVSLKFSDDLIKSGGVLLRTVNGERSFDNRFPARIDRILPELRLEIVKNFEEKLGSDFMGYGKSGR